MPNKKIEWITRGGYKVKEKDKKQMVTDVLHFMEENRNESLSYSLGGDTLIIAFQDAETGDWKIFDCEVRRMASLEEE